MDGRKYGALSCRPGFILAEALVILFLVSLAGALTFPSIRSWQEEKELDLAAETLAAAIRQVQVLSRNDTGRYGNTANEYYFFCLPDDRGEVIYYTRRGVSRMEPEGKLPASIRLSGRLELAFRKDFAGDGETYSAVLTTRDGKYKRQVTVAMYTGRVRVN